MIAQNIGVASKSVVPKITVLVPMKNLDGLAIRKKKTSRFLMFPMKTQLINGNMYQQKRIASKYLRALLSLTLSPDGQLTILSLVVLYFLYISGCKKIKFVTSDFIETSAPKTNTVYY